MSGADRSSSERHSTYWPIVVPCGVIPSGVIAAYGVFVVLAAAVLACSDANPWSPLVIYGTLLGVSALNLSVYFRSSTCQSRGVFWLALIGNFAVVLISAYGWKRAWASHLEAEENATACCMFGVFGFGNLIALTWTRVAATSLLHFSIRQLGGLFLGLSVLFAAGRWILCPGQMHCYDEQRPAAGHFRDLGADITWEDWQVTRMRLDVVVPTDSDLQRLAELPNLQSLELVNVEISRADLRAIREILPDCQVTVIASNAP